MALHSKHISFIEKCYELYEQKMFRVALSVLHDESLAEDAVQDAFLQLIKHEVHFNDAGSDDCKRYIITVTRNASINIYNKKKNENKIVSYPEDLESVCDSNAVTDGGIHDEGAEITPLMDSLPKKYYDVVECLVIRDYTVAQTAECLKLTEANVRKRYERAKKMIREAYGHT